jgi:hypothetical protein
LIQKNLDQEKVSDVTLTVTHGFGKLKGQLQTEVDNCFS